VDLEHLLDLDDRRRDLQAGVESLRQRRNQLSRATKTIAAENAEEHLRECSRIAEELEQLEKQLREVKEQHQTLLLLLPGLPAADVPLGETDDDNVELSRWREPRQFDFAARDHIELARLGWLSSIKQGSSPGHEHTP
jgi:seryl-tRNA synthetase